MRSLDILVRDDNFIVLGAPETEDRVSERLHGRGPGDGGTAVDPLRSVSVADCLFEPFDAPEPLDVEWGLAGDSAPPQPKIRIDR